MIKNYKFVFILVTFLLLNVLTSINVSGCKDIVVVNEATGGEYNLLLKVRDPSRPGPQVLCIIPEGYKYSYHHPWTGKQLEFTTQHKYIGVATNNDVIPNIVKAGMSLSDVGIAYGDADTGSNWRNPSKNAWDDFDWIRYACEKANNEDTAIQLMTEDLVEKMHASAVSENLFIVGPKKAYLIEADAFHYKVKEINDFLVMSNYPKELWRTQRHKKLPISSSFEIKKEQYVRRGRVIRLGSLYGVKIVEIGEDYIVARQIPFLKFNNGIRIMGNKVKINLGERETVGDYSVQLQDINGNKAKVSICYVFKAWEDKMLEYIQSKYGDIDLQDMINWSRLDSNDLDGLRPMCEEIFPYESVMIYKIPEENYNVLSSGWFSANHACSSIYIPVHICNTDIYYPYKTGEAAELFLNLLETYGHKNLTSFIVNVEDVFLKETEKIEEIATRLLKKDIDVSSFITSFDMSMQKQAFLTEQLWFDTFDNNFKEIDLIKNMWQQNYSYSLEMMENTVYNLNNISKSSDIIARIIEIVLSIIGSRINAISSIGRDTSILEDEFKTGAKFLQNGEYDLGFSHIQKSYEYSELLFDGKEISKQSETKESNQNQEIWTDFNKILIGLLFFTVFMLIIKKRYFNY